MPGVVTLRVSSQGFFCALRPSFRLQKAETLVSWAKFLCQAVVTLLSWASCLFQLFFCALRSFKLQMPATCCRMLNFFAQAVASFSQV